MKIKNEDKPNMQYNYGVLEWVIEQKLVFPSMCNVRCANFWIVQLKQ